MRNVPQSELNNLEALLLNTSGNVPLHNRFRALFTLKALKTDQAVHIISKGEIVSSVNSHDQRYAGFRDPSTLLKHELAYCLGQMKNTAALEILEAVLTNEQEDPMVRHEVSFVLKARFNVFIYVGGRSDGCYLLSLIYPFTQEVSERSKSYSTRDVRDRASEARVGQLRGRATPSIEHVR